MMTSDTANGVRQGAQSAREAPAGNGEDEESIDDSSDALELLVGFAHDLRSPLTSILFLSEALQRGRSGPINELQRRQLGIIYTAALELISMADDIVDLATGCGRLIGREPEPFSLPALLASVRDIVWPMAEKKNLDLRCRPPAGDSRLGYPVALGRVLLNLTTNAVKSTDRGYVEICARPVSATRLEFCVCDTGVGIDPGLLDPLLNAPRGRPGREDRRHARSAGLGLRICCQLLEAMGAEWRAQTRPGRGTRFYFELELPPAS